MKRLRYLFLCVSLFGQAAAEEAPSFRRDVMPVLFRAGCNAGTCHGSARGKDGFMLSLFGYDAKGDYYRLTQEMVGRRVNVAAPEERRSWVGSRPERRTTPTRCRNPSGSP
jgi:hypothetical protein